MEIKNLPSEAASGPDPRTLARLRRLDIARRVLLPVMAVVLVILSGILLKYNTDIVSSYGDYQGKVTLPIALGCLMALMSLVTFLIGFLPPQRVKRWMWVLLLVAGLFSLVAAFVFMGLITAQSRCGRYLDSFLCFDHSTTTIEVGWASTALCFAIGLVVALWVARIFPPPGTLVTGPRIKSVAGATPNKRQRRNKGVPETAIPVATDVPEAPPLLPPGNPYATGVFDKEVNITSLPFSFNNQ
jgi:hypothetical protein